MAYVIVTPRSLSQARDNPLLDRIRDAGYEVVFPSPGATPSESELLAVLPEAVGYLAGVENIDARLLAQARRLRVISRNGTGIDNIDLAAAKTLNIEIRKADGANARGVAELAFALMLSAARSIPTSDFEMKNSRWDRVKGFELEGKTLGLLGCGKIGKLVAQFALAFDMQVLAYDLFPDPTFAPSDRFQYAGLQEVIAGADVLSLHCPPARGGQPLLSSEEFGLMKKGVVIINTARQSLVDEVALQQALSTNSVAVYTMDAFEPEPPREWALVKNHRVIATPHLGAFTEESIRRASEVAVNNLLESLTLLSRSMDETRRGPPPGYRGTSLSARPDE